MNEYVINAIASAVICFWATWCVLSPRVEDGILGKLVLSCTAVAAFACAVAPTFDLSPPPEITLKVCIAVLGVRHWLMSRVIPSFRPGKKPGDQCHHLGGL